MGLRRDKGKALIAETGGDDGAALGHQAVQRVPRKLADELHLGQILCFGPVGQRTVPGHKQQRCVPAQNAPCLNDGAQTL